MAVTDGEDQPATYPHLFRSAGALVLNKIDLLPLLQFNVDRCLAHARRVHPGLSVFRVSSTRGDGLEDWCGWLHRFCGAPATSTPGAMSEGSDR